MADRYNYVSMENYFLFITTSEVWNFHTLYCYIFSGLCNWHVFWPGCNAAYRCLIHPYVMLDKKERIELVPVRIRNVITLLFHLMRCKLDWGLCRSDIDKKYVAWNSGVVLNKTNNNNSESQIYEWCITLTTHNVAGEGGGGALSRPVWMIGFHCIYI